MSIWNDKVLVNILKKGKVAVMPTDTIYGIVGSALNLPTVNKIYSLRKRAPEKPCIILIGDIDDLQKFSINLSTAEKIALEKYWPGPVSIVFDCLEEQFEYIHRGTKTLAFRLPQETELRNLLLNTGPLVAPSANIEGKPAAKNIKEALSYFGGSIDIYIDGGSTEGKPSRIMRLYNDGSTSIIRE